MYHRPMLRTNMKKCLQCEQLYEVNSIKFKYKHICPNCFLKIKELESINLRYCRRCKQEKTIDKFKGPRHVCRNCNNIKEWQRCKENGSRNRWRESHKEHVILNRIKARCNNKNIPFNLELTDIVIPEFCPILGIKLQKSYVQGNRYNSRCSYRKCG